MMKKITVSLCISAFLFSCDQNENSTVGVRPPVVKPPRENISVSTDGTTDAPLDGGLSILLVAGAAYGVRRFRNKGQKGE
jgi:hypothetical protein